MRAGYRAVKFGWGPMGQSEASDIATSVIGCPSVAATSKIMALVALGRVRARR